MIINSSAPRTRTSAHTEKSALSRKAAALAAATLLGLGACMTSEEKADPDPVPVEDGILFALGSDRKTAANYSVLGLDSEFVQTGIDPIHTDAVVRYFGGNDIFILNRLGRDNLQIVDRHNLKTVLQFDFDAASNPQDVVLKDGILYVAFMGTDKIGIYSQEDGKALGEIDISAYADTSDKRAEPFDLEFAGGNLYAVTQNLDTKNGWVPLTAHLIKIDVAAKKAVKALELPYGNPSAITYDSTAGKFYIPCKGEYSNEDYSNKTDGGIVTVDLSKFEIGKDVATEEDLGGNVNEGILYNGKLFMDLTSDAGEKIIAIALNNGKAEEIAVLDPYAVGGMALDAKSATLFVGDRKKDEARLRIFDADTYKEKAGSKVNLGLPPSDMVVVR